MNADVDEHFPKPAAADKDSAEQDRCPLSGDELLRLVAEMVD
jgi:hypothetical protein